MKWCDGINVDKKKKKKITIDDVIKIHKNFGVSFGQRFCAHTWCECLIWFKK